MVAICDGTRGTGGRLAGRAFHGWRNSAFGTGSGSGSEGGAGLDGATLSALGDLANGFWPLLLGGVVLLILLLRGEQAAVIPLAGGAILLQAWQSGVLR